MQRILQADRFPSLSPNFEVNPTTCNQPSPLRGSSAVAEELSDVPPIPPAPGLGQRAVTVSIPGPLASLPGGVRSPASGHGEKWAGPGLPG